MIAVKAFLAIVLIFLAVSNITVTYPVQSSGKIIIEKVLTEAQPLLTIPVCFRIAVTMNVTNINSQLQFVSIGNFFLVVNLPNRVVGNSSDTSFLQPANEIKNIATFPQITILIKLFFPKVCLDRVLDLKLFYFDGPNSNSWRLP